MRFNAYNITITQVLAATVATYPFSSVTSAFTVPIPFIKHSHHNNDIDAGYHRPLFSKSESTPCDMPKEIDGEKVNLTSKKGSGAILRYTDLTDINGQRILLDVPMGKETSIVIFLRHMG